MRIHVFQHVPFEGIGCLEQEFSNNNDELSYTHWYANPATPNLNDIDCLIVMGGPMGVHDEADFPWLVQEKALILDAIQTGKKVLGICLGAQLIAQVLGAKVAFSGHREIGWFGLTACSDHPLSSLLCSTPAVFHWHGDTFEIPQGAVHLASSEACKNQAFVLNDKVFGFQFHLETTPQSAAALIEHCANDLDSTRYVQTQTQIIDNHEGFSAINWVMREVWNYIKQI